MTSREIIKRLEEDGWRLVRIAGGHHHFRHSAKLDTVTVPHPKKDMPLGTLKNIARQAELKLD